VAMGEGSGIARLSLVPSPAFTTEYPKPATANPQMVNNHFQPQLPDIRCNSLPSPETKLIPISSA